MVLTSGTGRPHNESGRREGRECRAEDVVREKFRNLQVSRGGGGGLQERTTIHIYSVYRRNMYICRRRSTPHMRMDWGYTVPYLS